LKEKAKIELSTLSFSDAQIEAAFKQAKTFTTDELMDIIVTLGPIEDPKPAVVQKDPGVTVKWKVYNCSQCTFLNEDNPGPKCCICEFDAPASAREEVLSQVKIEALEK
jgi:rubrerythrin